MASGPWRKLYASASADPAIKRLAHHLGISPNEALGAVVRLWCYGTQFAPDGVLDGMDAADIEIEMGWQGGAGAMVAAMMHERIGLLDFDGAEYSIHNNDEYVGSHKEKLRKQKNRDRKKAAAGKAVPGPSMDSPRTSPEVSRDKPGSVPGQTSTEEKREEENRTDPPSATVVVDPGTLIAPQANGSSNIDEARPGERWKPSANPATVYSNSTEVEWWARGERIGWSAEAGIEARDIVPVTVAELAAARDGLLGKPDIGGRIAKVRGVSLVRWVRTSQQKARQAAQEPPQRESAMRRMLRQAEEACASLEAPGASQDETETASMAPWEGETIDG